ncbi:hypothetical protein [Thermomonospora umbrina]|uniref:Uncharacterized protein n=1 Tax=Thermomonospora umbrina TaxID=111806 RepID=A0A3D9SUY8_9ACTN|nr:hypothetical protein [Thermomonospora umbrina]REE95491.1 hypothetical protein DFJ69_0881 [Thermomonospora umbrina]
MRVPTDQRPIVGRELLSRRLETEFAVLSAESVRRCVADVLACMAHLGVEPAPAVVERMAREHLVGMVKSEPPSGRASLEGARLRPGPDDAR